jgi:hypothetical protein
MPVEGYIVRFPYPARPSGWSVAIRSKEWKAYQADITVRARARLKLVVNDYCTDGPASLNNTDFRFLGHKGSAGVTIRLEEFKAWGVRLFGFLHDNSGSPTFFVTGMDEAKKQQKGSQVKIAAAVKEAVRVRKILG